MTDTSWLEIDLSGLRRNVAVWRRLLARADRANGGGNRLGDGRGNGKRNGSRRDHDRPGPRLCGVIKADAYGLGGGEIARCLLDQGVDMLTVYSPAQADELLWQPIKCPILILMPVRHKPETVRLHQAMTRGQLHLSIDSPDQLTVVNSIGRSYRRRVPVHLALDTGMSRGGLTAGQLADVLARLPALRHVKLAGIWTHFAAADSDAQVTEEQFARFEQAIATNRRRIGRDVMLHAASTFGAMRRRRYHLDMVRVGVGLYGYGAPLAAGHESAAANTRGAQRGMNDGGCVDSDRVDADCADTGAFDAFEDEHGYAAILPEAHDLRPILRWRGRIVHVRRYPKGAVVGYNCTHRLMRDSYLGIVPIGYADGYPLSLSNRSQVLMVNGRRASGDCLSTDAAPVVGRVNMDQIIIDLTAATSAGCESAPRAQVGDVVELISDDPASPCALPRLAELAGSSCYELLSRLSPRIRRCYISAQEATPAAKEMEARQAREPVVVR